MHTAEFFVKTEKSTLKRGHHICTLTTSNSDPKYSNILCNMYTFVQNAEAIKQNGKKRKNFIQNSQNRSA
jgi:hypothetical protein